MISRGQTFEPVNNHAPVVILFVTFASWVEFRGAELLYPFV